MTKCIYCGKQITDDNYIEGTICGQHDAKMCFECLNGDGAKYVDDGTYGNFKYSVKETPAEKLKIIFMIIGASLAYLIPILIVCMSSSK